MAASVVSIKPPDAWEPPPSTPLDEAAWDAWVSKGLIQEKRTEAKFVKSIKFAAMAALMAGSALWSRVTVPSEAMVKFIVVAGSIVVLSRAFRSRQYAVAAVFTALAVIYNPIAPLFEFSGWWQHAFVAATAVVFASTLVWSKEPLAANA